MKQGLPIAATLFTALIMTNTVFAQNLINSCKNTGGSVRGCRVAETKVLDKVCYDIAGTSECPDLDITLNYNFACSGLDMGIAAIPASGGSEFLKFGKGVARFSGVRAPLIIKSPNTMKTAFATVNPSCSLKVVSVQASPSFTALSVWAERAQTHITALNGAMDSFALTMKLNDLQSLQVSEISAVMDSIKEIMDRTLLLGGFSDGLIPFQDAVTGDLIPRDKLSPALQAEWDEALTVLPQLLDYVNTLSQLQALRDGGNRPPVSEAELQASQKRTQAALQRVSKGDLQTVLKKAEDFAQSMSRINGALKGSLKTSLSELDRLLTEGRGLVAPAQP